MRYLISTALLAAVACTAPADAPPDAPAEAPPAQRDLETRLRTANQVLIVEGDASRAPEFFAPSFSLHGMEEGGPELIQGFVTQLHAGFSDISIEIDILHQTGDTITWLRSHRATHDGEFMGIPATNRTIEWTEIITTRYDGEMIAEEWAVSDLMGVLLAGG